MMKRIIVIVLILSLTVGLWAALPLRPHTTFDAGKQLFTDIKPWVLLRAAGALDSNTAATVLSSVDLSAGTYLVDRSNIAATNGMIDILGELGYGVNSVTIAFFSVDDAANDTFDIELYAWKDSPYGPAMPVFLSSGNACITGTMACLKHPTLGTTQASGKWIDTISGTDCWPSGVIIADSGNNRLCTLTFDLMGCRFIRLRLWDAASGGTVAAKIGAIVTGY